MPRVFSAGEATGMTGKQGLRRAAHAQGQQRSWENLGQANPAALSWGWEGGVMLVGMWVTKTSLWH